MVAGNKNRIREVEAGVTTILRIPGTWRHHSELLARMPKGFQLTSEVVILPDGTEIEYSPMPPDDMFAKVFQSACRHPAAAEEMRRVNRYTVNIGLSGPGGSMAAARTMMQAGGALVRAGGAGVFIDNSALAHGGGDWLKMTEDAGWDAVSFAFVNVVRAKREMRTVGMHVIGRPEIVLQHSDVDDKGRVVKEVIHHLCLSDKPIVVGQVLACASGPRFRVTGTANDPWMLARPMRNPLGCLKLARLKDVAACQ